MKLECSPDNFRALAEAHFKLALALEYSEQNEDAVEQIHQAMLSISKRVVLLEPVLNGKGKQAAVVHSPAHEKEVAELKGFLLEMNGKVMQYLLTFSWSISIV